MLYLYLRTAARQNPAVALLVVQASSDCADGGHRGVPPPPPLAQAHCRGVHTHARARARTRSHAPAHHADAAE